MPSARAFAAILFAVIFAPLPAAAQVPHIEGSLEVSVARGTIDAELSITNIPRVQNHAFLLNTGLNIQYIRSLDGDTNYRYRFADKPERFPESRGYGIPDDTGKKNFIPGGLAWKYTGKFPVIADMEAAAVVDWKGNIAFNGATLRADGMQTAWFPQFYDGDKDHRFYRVTYDIQVRCDDCRSLYVNGSEPVRGQSGRFVSKTPVEPLLFLGDYAFSGHGGNLVLNSPRPPEFTNEALAIVSRYQSRFAELFGRPFEHGGLTFIYSTPVSRNNSWGWASSPSIVNVSHQPAMFAGLLSDDRDKQVDKASFIAHELAHVYCSQFRQFNSDFGMVLSESLAEYLSYLIIEREFGRQAGEAMVRSKLQSVRDAAVPSLSEVLERPGGMNGFVRYDLVPAIWMQMEAEIGREQMLAWITALLTRETHFTDYAFVRRSLREVLGEGALADRVIEKYFNSTAYLAAGAPVPAAGN